MQGHSDLKCGILHPELRQNVNKVNERKDIDPSQKEKEKRELGGVVLVKCKSTINLKQILVTSLKIQLP